MLLLGSFIATGYHSSSFSHLTIKKYMQCLVISGCCNKYHKLGALSTNLFLTALKDGSLKSWCLCMGLQVADIQLYLHMTGRKRVRYLVSSFFSNLFLLFNNCEMKLCTYLWFTALSFDTCMYTLWDGRITLLSSFAFKNLPESHTNQTMVLV
jgi:hypothetical protein